MFKLPSGFIVDVFEKIQHNRTFLQKRLHRLEPVIQSVRNEIASNSYKLDSIDQLGNIDQTRELRRFLEHYMAERQALLDTLYAHQDKYIQLLRKVEAGFASQVYLFLKLASLCLYKVRK
jgi:chromosome segregation ATPase